MVRRSTPTIHPIGCRCDSCGTVGRRSRRLELAIKGATRALFLIAVVCAIPFIIARFVASIQEERR